VVTKKKT